MRYKMLQMHCKFLGVLYVNAKSYKSTRVWKEGGKLLINVYVRK
jgi:hypothetical protein